MRNLFDEINKILSDWNPVEVPIDIAENEYKSYVTRIINIGANYDKVKAELITILTTDMGLTFDENDLYQQDELDKVARRVMDKLI